MAVNTPVTAVVCIAIALTLIFSGIFLLVFIKRGRMKKPVVMFLLSLAFVDTLAAGLWSVFTALTSVSGEWALPDEICRLQVWFMWFTNAVNMHILTILMFERFLRFFMPSKHQEIVFDTVALLAIGGIWLFDGVIASFPMWGYGETAYFSTQYQCAVDYELHVTQLHFTLAVHFILPVCLILGFYIASLVRLNVIRRRLQPGQAIILEENMEFRGDGFSERLKRQYLKFKNPGEKTKQAKIECRLDADGFKRESDDESSDDDVIQTTRKDDVNFEDGGKMAVKKKKPKTSKRKTHYLSRDDVLLTHMVGLAALVYLICWFLYIVQAYIYTYAHKTLGDTLVLVAVILSHFGSCLKFPCYLLYPRIRNSLKKTFGVDSGDSKSTPNDQTANEQTTEL